MISGWEYLAAMVRTMANPRDTLEARLRKSAEPGFQALWTAEDLAVHPDTETANNSPESLP